MIEWSLIDCLSPQDLQSTSVLWTRPLWQHSTPAPPVELSWALTPSSMIHELWSSLLTLARLQHKPSGRTQTSCPLHNKWAKETGGSNHPNTHNTLGQTFKKKNTMCIWFTLTSSNCIHNYSQKDLVTDSQRAKTRWRADITKNSSVTDTNCCRLTSRCTKSNQLDLQLGGTSKVVHWVHPSHYLFKSIMNI